MAEAPEANRLEKDGRDWTKAGYFAPTESKPVNKAKR
jgi:hypothetical protein